MVCILYVGVQLLLPGQDAGIDFAREYELAKGMAGGERVSMPDSGLGAKVYALTATEPQHYFVKRTNPPPMAIEGTLG